MCGYPHCCGCGPKRSRDDDFEGTELHGCYQLVQRNSSGTPSLNWAKDVVDPGTVGGSIYTAHYVPHSSGTFDYHDQLRFIVSRYLTNDFRLTSQIINPSTPISWAFEIQIYGLFLRINAGALTNSAYFTQYQTPTGGAVVNNWISYPGGAVGNHATLKISYTGGVCTFNASDENGSILSLSVTTTLNLTHGAYYSQWDPIEGSTLDRFITKIEPIP